MAGYRQSFAPDRCAKRAAARIPGASSGQGPPALVAAAIGGGDGFDLHRCWDVEHDVHDIAQPANVKPGDQICGRVCCWCAALCPMGFEPLTEYTLAQDLTTLSRRD